MQYHSMSRPDAGQRLAINERTRVVIALPDGTTFYSDRLYIGVAFDLMGNTMIPNVLGPSSGLPFLARYNIMSLLCGGRAMGTVDGTVIVNGETITPERYLGIWRTAIAEPLTAAQFTERHGYEIVAVLGGSLDPLRGTRTSWSSSPFKTFDDFEAAYRGHMAYYDEGWRFRIELDLRRDNAARDAFYLQSFLSCADQRDAAFIAFNPVGPTQMPCASMPNAQSDLFVATGEAL